MITITKKINFCNYDENDVVDQNKWEVDYNGEVGTFFDTIAYQKEFDDDINNPVSTGGEVEFHSAL